MVKHGLGRIILLSGNNNVYLFSNLWFKITQFGYGQQGKVNLISLYEGCHFLHAARVFFPFPTQKKSTRFNFIFGRGLKKEIPSCLLDRFLSIKFFSVITQFSGNRAVVVFFYIPEGSGFCV